MQVTPERQGVSDPYAMARIHMVERQLEPSDIEDERILDAMRTVPRHLFVPPEARHLAYGDHPVPVGRGQTISQPYVVACMIQMAAIEPGHRVLDVGTGSGYQAAVLAEMGCDVWSVEILDDLAVRARHALDHAGYGRVRTRIGDGWAGWPEGAPFDAILVGAAASEAPPPLKQQLRIGGRLVMPLGGDWEQILWCITRTSPTTWREEEGLHVLFVPMTGAAIRRGA